MCIGLRLCSKKSCIEQEKCLYPEARSEKKVKVNPCQVDKFRCTNARSCEILGQCILDHPLVKQDKMASKQLRKKLEITAIIKIITRLMPSLNKPRKKVHGKPKP